MVYIISEKIIQFKQAGLWFINTSNFQKNIKNRQINKCINIKKIFQVAKITQIENIF